VLALAGALIALVPDKITGWFPSLKEPLDKVKPWAWTAAAVGLGIAAFF
jgi:hypothetical protein